MPGKWFDLLSRYAKNGSVTGAAARSAGEGKKEDSVSVVAFPTREVSADTARGVRCELSAEVGACGGYLPYSWDLGPPEWRQL
jgi:hypothetical protein